MPFPSPEDLPNPGIEPGSPALEADALISEPQMTQINGEIYHVHGLEESTCLTSGSTTKPQSSRQYGTGTKAEI